MSNAKRFNSGKTRFDLIPNDPIRYIADVYTRGAHKYTAYQDENGAQIQGKGIPIEEVAKRKLTIIEDGADNWRLGQDWMSSMGSIKRHIESFMSGEDIDPELGTYHLANAAWGIITLLEFYKTHPELDNRKHAYLQQKKIGLDIDEVLCDFVGGMMERYPDEFTSAPQFWNCPTLSKLFGEIKDDHDFWLSLKPKVSLTDMPFEPHCYITSRSVPSDVTMQWLNKHGFPSAPVYTVVNGMSKVEVAKKSGIQLFVDDRYENFVELNRAGVCCFLFDAPHNQRYNVGYKRINSLKQLL